MASRLRRVVIKGVVYKEDVNGNMWSTALFPGKGQIEKIAATLVGCRWCMNCTDMSDSEHCVGCRASTLCFNCVDCHTCEKCNLCSLCSKCVSCRSCTDCVNCMRLSNCKTCNNSGNADASVIQFLPYLHNVKESPEVTVRFEDGRFFLSWSSKVNQSTWENGYPAASTKHGNYYGVKLRDITDLYMEALAKLREI